MDAAPTSIGVAAAAPTPPPAWPEAPRWTTSTEALSVRLSNPAPAWSRPAQGAAALFLLLAIGLLAWHTYAAQRISCRPTILEPGAEAAFLDLNAADRAQLLQLPGVGENLAARIETYRTEHNGFRDVEELRNVGGIGPKLLEKLRPFVKVVPRIDGERAIENEAPLPRSPGKKPRLAKPININLASGTELQCLPGIGPKLSQRILDTRAKKAFQSVDDLRRVPGIGPKKLEQLRPYVVVGS